MTSKSVSFFLIFAQNIDIFDQFTKHKTNIYWVTLLL